MYRYLLPNQPKTKKWNIFLRKGKAKILVNTGIQTTCNFYTGIDKSNLSPWSTGREVAVCWRHPLSCVRWPTPTPAGPPAPVGPGLLGFQLLLLLPAASETKWDAHLWQLSQGADEAARRTALPGPAETAGRCVPRSVWCRRGGGNRRRGCGHEETPASCSVW